MERNDNLPRLDLLYSIQGPYMFQSMILLDHRYHRRMHNRRMIYVMVGRYFRVHSYALRHVQYRSRYISVFPVRVLMTCRMWIYQCQVHLILVWALVLHRHCPVVEGLGMSWNAFDVSLMRSMRRLDDCVVLQTSIRKPHGTMEWTTRWTSNYMTTDISRQGEAACILVLSSSHP
jgi:hypothetical protein